MLLGRHPRMPVRTATIYKSSNNATGVESEMMLVADEFIEKRSFPRMPVTARMLTSKFRLPGMR